MLMRRRGRGDGRGRPLLTTLRAAYIHTANTHQRPPAPVKKLLKRPTATGVADTAEMRLMGARVTAATGAGAAVGTSAVSAASRSAGVSDAVVMSKAPVVVTALGTQTAPWCRSRQHYAGRGARRQAAPGTSSERARR